LPSAAPARTAEGPTQFGPVAVTPTGAPPPPPPPKADAAALVSAAATTAAPPPPPPPKPVDLPDASALVAKPKEPAEGPDVAEQPAAQRPQAPQPKAPSVQRRPPTRRLEPGDLICPECGEGNEATRKFCSRCGTSLQAAEVVKKKWWQRFIPRRGPKKRKAGDRPSARKTRKSFPMKMLGVMAGGMMRIIGIVVLVGGLVYGFVPAVRNLVNDDVSSVEGWFKSVIHPNHPQVHQTAVTVSSNVRNHGFEALKDDAPNTYWAARMPPKNSARQLKISFAFGETFDLKNLDIWNGIGTASGNGVPSYDNTARPRQVQLTSNNNETCTITFQDSHDKTSLDVPKSCHANGIDELSLTIVNYYGKTGNHKVALANVEFFKS
jgi:hypothetical protein